MKKGYLHIATNSVNMMYNYREKFLKDAIKKYNINYVLSHRLDTELRYGESYSLLSQNSSNPGRVALVQDFFKVVGVLLRHPNHWVVFTARNILLFGLASRFTFTKLNIAYYAGLGKGMSAESMTSSTGKMLFWRFALKNYQTVYCLNHRDKSLLDLMHSNVEFIRGEGFDLAVKAPSDTSHTYQYDFGFVGRFTPEKGGRDFIAFARKNPASSFVIFGEIETQLVSDVNILSNVFVMGFVADKDEIYRSFEILLHLSSLNEGLPFVFFECIVFQKLLFAYENPTTNEFLREVGVEPVFPRRISMEVIHRFASVPTATDGMVRECRYENTNMRMLECL